MLRPGSSWSDDVRKRPAITSLDVFEELARSALQRFSDFHNVFEADIPFTALRASHERPMNASLVRKGLLGDASR